MPVTPAINIHPPSPASADLAAPQLAAIESLTQSIGRDLLESLERREPQVWQRRWWDDRLMEWSMQDEQLKVQLFRFVDVLPMLTSSDAVMGHLHEYLDRVRDRLPSALNVALGVARRVPFTRAAVARAAKLSATDFARRFIAGENVRQVLAAAKRERELRRGFTLDILGEAVISEPEAEQYFRAYLDLLEGITPEVQSWPDDPLLDRDNRGPIPRVNLSIKLSALDSQFDAIDPEGTTRRVGGRLRELFRAARRLLAFINVDMESYDKKDLTLHIFKRVLSEPEFRDWTDAGIVIQCYLRDAERDLVELRDWAMERGTPVWVRLVKGAYWDYETIKARANSWPVPVFQQKWHSDASFERCTRFALQNTAWLRPALGLAQPPLAGPRHRHGPRSGARPGGAGAANALRHGRRREAGPGRSRPAAADLHALWRADPRHGVPRPAAPGKHVERLVPAGRVRWTTRRRTSCSKPRRH
jgi:RHH-type transcriptional regulator, proline utilization regulon repressor / proline dehydrogenase / delta 1-pyrroline-5-carboxylate dehydrogenase